MKQITNDEEHAAALARIEELWCAEEGSPEAEEGLELVILVANYELQQMQWEEL